MNKQEILEQIRRTAEANGGSPLGTRRFFKETGIRESAWIGIFWSKWSDAVREAGFEPNTKNEAYEEGWLLEKLAGLARELGHFPVRAELRMKAREDADFPSHNVFSRFGRKDKVASALSKWCAKKPEWQDVHTMCAPHVATPDNETAEHHEDEPSVGYVYLLKSGKYYKIGRSNAPGRRQYELAIQLPEPVVTVHEIETDDPVGIERYWHQRFSDRRKNGEWFCFGSAGT